MSIDSKETVIGQIYNSELSIANPIVANHRLFEKLFEDLPLSFCVWDYRLDIIASNDEYMDTLGIASQEIFAEKFFEMSPDKQPDGQISSTKMLNLITKTFKEGHSESFWVHLDENGEEFSVELTFKKFEIDNSKTSDIVFMFAKDMNIKNTTVLDLDCESETMYNYYLQKLFLQHLPVISDSILFCYDVKKSTFKYYTKNEAGESILNTSTNFPNMLIKEGFVHKNDMLKFLEIVDDINAGVIKKSDIRLVLDGAEVWHEINYEIITNSHDEVVLAVGKFTSISDRETLENKEKLDSLTNCYNQVALNNILGDILDSSTNDETHTLWIAEVCDISTTNLKYGSQFADLMLIDMAKQLRENLEEYIIGRVYGKFVLFCKNCGDNSNIEERTKEIIKCFFNSYEIKEDVCITACNIGASKFPLDGKNLTDLYSSANFALEDSKERGENEFSIYEPSMGDSAHDAQDMSTDELSVNSKNLNHKLCSEVFNLLYTKNVDSTSKINSLVELVCKEFKLDRCFILEKQDDFYTATNIYAVDGVDTNITKVNPDEIPSLNKDSNFQGVTAYEDCTEKSDKTACLVGSRASMSVKIIVDGNIYGILAGDMCNATRHWSAKEVNTFAQISKIISALI
ncbi:MAG: diguanylate cyclase [Clostridia bacterium]